MKLFLFREILLSQERVDTIFLTPDKASDILMDLNGEYSMAAWLLSNYTETTKLKSRYGNSFYQMIYYQNSAD
jgi:hypothetical protein